MGAWLSGTRTSSLTGGAEHPGGDNARLEVENAALRIRVAELDAQVASLSEKVTTLAKLCFGAFTNLISLREGQRKVNVNNFTLLGRGELFVSR